MLAWEVHICWHLNPLPSPTMSTPYVTPAQVDRVLTYARARSELDACTLHVNATVRMSMGYPVVTALTISDWYSSDATIATFTNGRSD